MRRFGFKLLSFLILPLLFICLVENFIYSNKSELFSEHNLETIYKQDAANYQWASKINYDSLVILSGSSSVRYGLSCSELNGLSPNRSKYINVAMDARDPIQTYFILKNLDLKNISSIYYGLDPWIYTKGYYKHRDKYMYLDFSFLQTCRFSLEHDKSAFYKRYKSLLAFLFPAKDQSIQNENLEIPEDFGSVALVRQASNFDETVLSWFQLDKYGWSKLQFIYLKKIAELCHSKKIRFSTFIPPKRSDFSKDYKENCVAIHDEFLNNLVEVNFNSPIFGKFDQLDNLGDYDDFSEAYHLNRKGQKIYSKIFFDLSNKTKADFSKDYKWFEK